MCLVLGARSACGSTLQERPPDWDIDLGETWVSAAERHTPGHLDSALVSLARVQGDDVRRLWISIQVLLRFVDNPSIGRVRMPAPPGRDLRGGSVSREVVHPITSEERRRLSALLPRIRQLTRPGLLMRAVIVHTDIVTLDGGLAMLPPGQPTTAADPMRVMVGDGQARGHTALIEAALSAVLLADGDPGRNLVVMFSDGADTASFVPADRVIETARRSWPLVYAVAARRDDSRFLRDLATVTGGRLVETDDATDPGASLRTILDEVRRRYLVTFTPAGVERGGWHRLDVRVTRRGARVHARTGYVSTLR
jgi:hypothetical protein